MQRKHDWGLISAGWAYAFLMVLGIVAIVLHFIQK